MSKRDKQTKSRARHRIDEQRQDDRQSHAEQQRARRQQEEDERIRRQREEKMDQSRRQDSNRHRMNDIFDLWVAMLFSQMEASAQIHEAFFRQMSENFDAVFNGEFFTAGMFGDGMFGANTFRGNGRQNGSRRRFNADCRPARDLYDVLGVDRHASQADIKFRFRKLIMECHPDRHPDATPDEKKQLEKRLREVIEAYEILKDEDKRAYYDRFGVVT